MKVRAIITGATGMVGEGVLLECLDHPDVEQVLIINRSPGGVAHPKLKEIVHADFFDLKSVESELEGYNACFFCLGVSSAGISKEEYRQITYSLTLSVAQTLARVNPDMTFCYVSGAGTDSSGQGRANWARVKGETENALFALFQRAYMFRPAFLKPSSVQRRVKLLNRLIGWLYPIGRMLYPAGFCTLRELGLAMIHAGDAGYDKQILDPKDIIALAS